MYMNNIIKQQAKFRGTTNIVGNSLSSTSSRCCKLDRKYSSATIATHPTVSTTTATTTATTAATEGEQVIAMSKKPFDSIPGPRQLPFLGNALEFSMNIRNLHKLFGQWNDKYGDMVRFNLGGLNNIFLFNPEDMAVVHRTDNTNHVRPPNPVWQRYKNLRGGAKNLLEIEAFDDAWRSQKKVMTPLMHMENVTKFIIPKIAEVSNDLVHNIRSKVDPITRAPKVDFDEILYSYALEGAVALLYDKRMGLLEVNGKVPEDAQALINAIVGMFSTTCDLLFGLPFWQYFETPMLKKHFAHWDEIYRLANLMFKEYMSNRKEHSMVELILEQCKKEGFGQYEIDTVNSSLLAAAVDTTGMQTKWVLYHLARDQERQEKVYQEILAATNGADKAANITAEQLKRLPYLKDFVKESMRLNSIIISQQRVFDKDMEIRGYHIPAHTHIWLGVWNAAQSPKVFSDALEFRPERYKEGVDPKIASFANSPFGFGVRMCAGRRLAETELYMAVAKLVQNFKIKMDSTTMPDTSFRALISPEVVNKKEFTLQFHERE